MLKILAILVVLGLVAIAGVSYFVLWPLALQYLTALNTVLLPAVENIQDVAPLLPPELNINNLLAVVPLLGQIGTEGLALLASAAEGGITPEEAQQVMDLLNQQLSAEQISELKTLLNPGN